MPVHRPPLGRASRVAFPLLLLVALVTLSWDSHPSRGESPGATVQICRSWVEPCQKVVSIPRGETAVLDLRLRVTGDDHDGEPVPVVVWETHFSITNNQPARVVLEPANRGPVQERGNGDYALNGLARLGDGEDEPVGQYFTVQNRHDPASGSLDYSITLVGFASATPAPAAIPLANGDSLLLGRISLQGVADGSASIVPAAASEQPWQVVVLDQDDRVAALPPAGGEPLLSTINVGSAATTAELQGRVTPQYPGNTWRQSGPPMQLNVSFWTPKATPPWLGGDARPLATFYNLSTDQHGLFRIADISPALLPSGVYDLRVWRTGTLISLVPGVVIPAPGGSSQAGPPFLVSLRGGDTDGNNVVNDLDLEHLKTCFGWMEGEVGYAEVADLNGDKVVDGLDFSLMAQNFGARSE